MVGNSSLKIVAFAVRLYVMVTAVIVLAPAVTAVAAPHLATNHAWGDPVVVAALLPVLLPLRLPATVAGSRSGLRAVGVISATLLVVNVVEALILGYFPTWMPVQMVGIAVLMAVIVLLMTGVAVATNGRGDRSAVAVQAEQRDL